MRALLDPNTQKTHYVLPPRKRKKLSDGIFKCLDGETSAHAEHRYRLYQQIWGRQHELIDWILNFANYDLFAQLLEFVRQPVVQKVDTSFLSMSTNTANNLRILEQFSNYMAESVTPHVHFVRMNSKVCFNVKVAMREFVNQVVEGKRERDGVADDVESEEEHLRENYAESGDEDPGNQNDDEDIDEDSTAEHRPNGKSRPRNNNNTMPSNESDADQGPDSDDDETDAEDADDSLEGRISYDFDIIADWIDNYRATTGCGDELRIVVIMEDASAFSGELINQLFQLFSVYISRAPLKVVVGLSSRNVSLWINQTLSPKLRPLIRGVRMETKDNFEIGFQVVDDLLLQNEITEASPLLLDAKLSLIILGRFENSHNSIDSLISEIRLAYMIHFYLLPVASMVDPEFQPEHFHYEALRRLPSFKMHMEVLVHGLTTGEATKEEILHLLDDDLLVHQLLNVAQQRFQTYQNSVMNAVHVIHHIDPVKQKFQIYKLITNNQLINSPYMNDVLRKVGQYTEEQTAEFLQFLRSDWIKDSVKYSIDGHVQILRDVLGEQPSQAREHVAHYLHNNPHVNMKISDNLFNEVFTISGGFSELAELQPHMTLEENYENLMINLIRPKLRKVIEEALDEPQKYLQSPAVTEMLDGPTPESGRLMGPMLCKLYQVFRDAPVNINVWDFYSAFRANLARAGIAKDLEGHELAEDLDSDDGKWDKVTYAWFVQSCSELTSMGFLREKSKGDYVEKLIWKDL